MATIPAEIITDILIRLPVKSLLRFRSVSKPWCSQIDDPAFAKLHHNHSARTNSRRSLILTHPEHLTPYSLDLDSLDQLFILEDPPATLNLVVGSCNGLLCTYTSVEEIFFWNPATRKHLKLPPMPVTSSKGFDPSSFDFHSMSYGFGYDSLHDDYKLVTIDRFCNTCVYSMKSNLWKRTMGFPISLAGQQTVGVFVSGVLHWMSRSMPTEAGNNKRCMIFAINLASKDYFPQKLPLPVNGARHEVDFDLGALDGSLSVACHTFKEGRIDVWVMKEYGALKSWTKLFSTAGSGYVCLRTLAYSYTQNGVVLEAGPCELLRYDLEKKRMESLQVPGCGWGNFKAAIFVGIMIGAQVFVESLVKPMTMAVGDGRIIGKPGKARNHGNANKRDSFLSKGFKLVL